MPAISIIVPIYKVEKYLCRCIDSILAQTFADFECILIDDGSPDNCGNICDEYAKKDARIIVIHQINSGVSSARNAGLDIAKGEWIGFVDGDDFCDSEMFQILYENAARHNADVSICGYKIATASGEIEQAGANYDNKLRMLNRENAILGIFSQGCGYFGGFSWNKLIKSELFSKNKLRYDAEIRYMQDIFLFYELFKHIEKAVYFLAPYYNYVCNPQSTTNQFGLTEKAKTAFTALDRIISAENNIKIKRSVILAKVIFAYDLCKHYVMQNDCNNKDFLFLKKIISNNKKYLLFDFSVSLKKKILCCLIFFPRLYRRVFYIAIRASARNIFKPAVSSRRII
jgi:glycosyltransferase involved in cell wall biosynthesis